MNFENDYIMRMIKEMIQALRSILFKTKFRELDLESQNLGMDDLPDKLLKMADQGKINEAENLLLDSLDETDLHALQAALLFYEHINEYTDEFLASHNYSRSEIADGVKEAARRYGIHGIAESLL